MEENGSPQSGSQDQAGVGLEGQKAAREEEGCPNDNERRNSVEVVDRSSSLDERWPPRKHMNTCPGKEQVTSVPDDVQDDNPKRRWIPHHSHDTRPVAMEASGCSRDCWQTCSLESCRDTGDRVRQSGNTKESRWLASQEGSTQGRQETPGSDERLWPQRLNGRTLQGGRVLRNRRYRRPFDDQRHTKRLFTPEIKKFLKDWLVRRRDHPYPNRDEKKRLAVDTGLTYIQICNWFANWRRKLKNAGSEQRTTWGHLIKSYNTQAQGNVEQFSICSDDSIWDQNALCETVDGNEEQEMPMLAFAASATAMDHCYSVVQNNTTDTVVDVATDRDIDRSSIPATEDQAQCFQVTSTTTEEEDAHSNEARDVPTLPRASVKCAASGTNKYKSHIMEKYMRDLQLEPSYEEIENLKKRADLQHNNRMNVNGLQCDMTKEPTPHSSTSIALNKSYSGEKNVRHEKKRRNVKKIKQSCPPMVLSKWLESAAKFKPTKSYVPWIDTKKDTWRSSRGRNRSKNTIRLNVTGVQPWATQGHQKEELDAAEALTTLSGLQH